MDWGIYQMDAVMDRKDITGSPFLVLTNFGDHALHHLFPTIDHGKLKYLYPTFLGTCKQFGTEWRLSSQIELVKGQYRQLARTTPNYEPKKTIHKHISWIESESTKNINKCFANAFKIMWWTSLYITWFERLFPSSVRDIDDLKSAYYLHMDEYSHFFTVTFLIQCSWVRH